MKKIIIGLICIASSFAAADVTKIACDDGHAIALDLIQQTDGLALAEISESWAEGEELETGTVLLRVIKKNDSTVEMIQNESAELTGVRITFQKNKKTNVLRALLSVKSGLYTDDLKNVILSCRYL